MDDPQGALKEAGFKPRLLDGRYENISRRLKEYVNEKTLFVGISSMTCNQIIFGIDAARAARKINSDIPIVWCKKNTKRGGDSACLNAFF